MENLSKAKDITKNQKNKIAVVVIILIVGFSFAGIFMWYGLVGGLQKQAAKNLNGIYGNVAADAMTQYEITKRNGNAIDVCIHAGLVSAAFLQAKDEVNYKKWKEIEGGDCARAEMPM